MTNELKLVDAEILTPEEKTELDAGIDRVIEAHKNNRKEINRLVFESVTAMTEADNATSELSSKRFFRRLVGGITGSNQALQNKINSNRAAAQYASQQTLQRLAEQNLMTFDLIAAVNNKLNASLYDVGEEFKHIYAGLEKFFKHNRNEMVRLETRLAKVEQNVQILNWQNSIEYQEFEGIEYNELDTAQKITCLVRDFYDITKGQWTITDLLLLKTAMTTIGLSPKMEVNYFGILKEIANEPSLQAKLLNGQTLRPIEDPGYLISMGTLKKLDSLEKEDAYTVETLMTYMKAHNVPADKETVCEDLTSQYMKEAAAVDVNVNVDVYDMILDLLYSLRQAKEESILVPIHEKKLLIRSKDALLMEAEKRFISHDLSTAFDKIKEMADKGNARAMYLLSIYYFNGYANITKSEKKGNEWLNKSAKKGESLARLCTARLSKNEAERNKQLSAVIPEIIALAQVDDVFAQHEIANLFIKGEGVSKDSLRGISWLVKAAKAGYWASQFQLGSYYAQGKIVNKDWNEAVFWYQKAASLGSKNAQNALGDCYYKGLGIARDYQKAFEWYQKAANQENVIAQNNLGRCYSNGIGIDQNIDKAIFWYQKAAEQGYAVAQNNLGTCYLTESRIVCHQYELQICLWKKFLYTLSGMSVTIASIQTFNPLNPFFRISPRLIPVATEHPQKGKSDTFLKMIVKAVGTIIHSLEKSKEELSKEEYNRDKIGVKHFEQAVKWYQSAANLGNATAQVNLGFCYYNGDGTTLDREKAFEYFQKAAIQGDMIAQNILGNCYWIGEGVRSNEKESVKWYRKAAEQGENWASVNLGMIYLIEDNVDDAKRLFLKAVSQGNNAALKILEVVLSYYGRELND